jgi:hypothetical protein
MEKIPTTLEATSGQFGHHQEVAVAVDGSKAAVLV